MAPALAGDLCSKLKRCQSDAFQFYLFTGMQFQMVSAQGGGEEKREGWW